MLICEHLSDLLKYKDTIEFHCLLTKDNDSVILYSHQTTVVQWKYTLRYEWMNR